MPAQGEHTENAFCSTGHCVHQCKIFLLLQWPQALKNALKNHQCSSLTYWLKRSIYRSLSIWLGLKTNKLNQPNLLEKSSQKNHTPKLAALPLSSSCSVSEGFAVRLCICVQPGNIGTMPVLVFISTAVSHFECWDSIRTLQLLQIVNIVISTEILLQRQKHRPWLIAVKIFHFPTPTTVTGIKMVLSCQSQIITTRQFCTQVPQNGPRASCERGVSQRGLIHTKLTKYNNYNYCIRW